MSNSKHKTMILLGGWSMILFAILFIGCTILIDNLAQAQTLLYSMEQHSLFKVAAGTETIRTLLVIYAVLPLLLIPAAVGCFYAFIDPHEAQMRCGMYFATAGALSLSLSLLMLPSINWHLATYISTQTGAIQGAMIIILQALHSYFGVFVGDILGLGCILVWLIITSIVMMRTSVMPHVMGVIELIIAIVAALLLVLRYSTFIPDVYINVQAPGLITLWLFLCGIGLVSLRKD